MTEEERLELEYLRYFYQEADFGPAHGDVIYIINENYTGTMPNGYGNEDEEED